MDFVQRLFQALPIPLLNFDRVFRIQTSFTVQEWIQQRNTDPVLVQYRIQYIRIDIVIDFKMEKKIGLSDVRADILPDHGNLSARLAQYHLRSYMDLEGRYQRDD